MSQQLPHRVARPLDELNGAAVRVQEIVDEEGIDKVIHAIDRGLPIYGTLDGGYLAQWVAYEACSDTRIDPEIILAELAR